MKKQTLLALTLIFIAVLSGCGLKTTQTPPKPATPTETFAPPTPTITPTDTPLPTATQTATQTATTSPTVDPSAEVTAAGVSYINDVLPIFNNSCNKCHGLEQIKEGLDMTRYETLMAGSFNGVVVIPGNATDSFLVQQLINGEMPKRGTKLTTDQIQIIINWVNAGAPNN